MTELELEQETQPGGPLRFREATLEAVNWPQRILEVLVSPYERETVVGYDGRMVREVFSRGAYDGIQRRANRIKVNRDHQVERTVGKAIRLHPGREEGLVAEVKISTTLLGDETLTLADDGVLDVSAGFLPMPGGELWNHDRSAVRITKAWLGHISLVPEPAYEDAKVLAVRQAAEQAQRIGTPNLDIVRGWARQQRIAELAASLGPSDRRR